MCMVYQSLSTSIEQGTKDDESGAGRNGGRWTGACPPGHRVPDGVVARRCKNVVYVRKLHSSKRKTLMHLFLKCSYTKRCWQLIGVISPRTSNQCISVQHMCAQLTKTWKMEVIIIMIWCMWKYRNRWIFENIPPMTTMCNEMFVKKMILLCHRVKPQIAAKLGHDYNRFPCNLNTQTCT
jgi:hypothetical protein